MRENLTPQDIKQLKQQCRPGIIIPFMLLCLITLITTFLLITTTIIQTDMMIQVIFVFAFILPFLLCFLMIRKYIADIRSGEKNSETKTITHKKVQSVYEAGSGTLFPSQQMNSTNSFSLIIENTRYYVSESFYNSCNENDQVFFYTAPISGLRLGMALKKGRNTAGQYQE